MRPLSEPESSGQGEPVKVLAPLTTEGLEGFRGGAGPDAEAEAGQGEVEDPG